MATHSSILAWRIPGTEEPSGLLSTGSQSRTRLKRLSSSSSSMACGIFLNQGSNPCLLHRQVDSLPLSHQGSPKVIIEEDFSAVLESGPLPL